MGICCVLRSTAADLPLSLRAVCCFHASQARKPRPNADDHEGGQTVSRSETAARRIKRARSRVIMASIAKGSIAATHAGLGSIERSRARSERATIAKEKESRGGQDNNR